MRFVSSTLLATLLLLPHAAHAGLNRNYLVPVFEPCPGSGNCNPPTRASSYTFDSIVLYSSPQRYIGPNKLALVIAVKGLRDASGNLATTTLEVRIAPGRITLLDGVVGTLGDTSPFNTATVYRIEVKNGAARQKFTTPENTPERALVAETLASPVLYDDQDKPLATTGTQAKP